MQKVFNVIACASFVMSGAMVAGAVVAYIRIPPMANKYISEIKLEMTEFLIKMVPPQIEGALPELPVSTGPAVPFQK